MTSETRTRLLDILAEHALSQTVEGPWSTVTLADLCAAGGVSLGDCVTHNISKAEVAAYLDKRLDLAMLSATPKVDHTQGVRDRLFDVLMGRFDALEENRASWTSILGGEKDDMASALARRARRARTGAWALEAAGVTSSDLRGATRAIAIARILRGCEKVWLLDGPDLAKTMARLDQDLRKAEEWVERAQAVGDFMRGRAPAVKPEAEPLP
jgi:hypothetical protein